jgi:DNA polymerase
MEDLARKKLEALYLAGEREIPNRSAAKKTQAPVSKATPKPKKTQSSSIQPKSLTELRELIGDCKRCRLCEERNNLVFGVGNPQAELMFVGEGPGRDEDLKGEPFVGRAGKLLDKIIAAMKLSREVVYIANVVKCRPPENRNPAPDEIETCEPFLLRQIEIIRPRVIVCLGTFAAQTLLQTDTRIGELRAKFHAWPSARVKAQFATELPEGSIQVMPTYHPAFLLRNPNMKRPLWEDMQQVVARLESPDSP